MRVVVVEIGGIGLGFGWRVYEGDFGEDVGVGESVCMGWG